ncbi:MAG: toprim domain-containing protein [Patescibacteria group bacterium]|nr:toprim domain-containing protein [Patescibacteria group bacterium]
MNDILEIKRRLSERAHDVAQMLLPHGRKEAHEWRVGSIDGERGQSLGVHLVGPKAGLWADFSTGEKGDLLDLWAAVRRIPLATVLNEARDYLGMQRPAEPQRPQKPSYTRPPKPKCQAPRNDVLDYLTVNRNLPRASIEAYRVGEDGNRIVFPFLLPDGELALAKVREAVDGAKPKPTAANCEPILFGWQAIPENAREVTITEGEIDALSMHAFGYPALSVPFGGGGKGKQNWIENEFERMERFERIYLAMDMDEVGVQAAAEIAARLGRHRCYRVALPRKDANECLMDGVTADEIAACMAAAQALDPEGLKTAAAYENTVARLFWPVNEGAVGYSVPYTPLYGKVLFRPGEVTLWSGASGDGKSMLISDCIPKWIQEGSRICLASLEMKPQWTLKRLAKQAGGVDRPTIAFLHEIMGYLDRGLLLYERVGKASVEALLEIFDYARAKYGCDQFVIDSLMRLGIAGDDYTGQEQAVFNLVDWAISANVHLHLVAHAKKAGKDRGVPETEDIKGAMEIGANAFNILTVYRNRNAEETEPDEHPSEDGFTSRPGVTLNVAKQRNGDYEGKTKLYFNRLTQQYFAENENRRHPRNYVPDPVNDEVAA